MNTTKELEYLYKKLQRKEYLSNQGLTIYYPVTTEDILLWGYKNNVFIRTTSESELLIGLGGGHYKISIHWQLGKDLSGQTPETIHELFTFVKEREDGKQEKTYGKVK